MFAKPEAGSKLTVITDWYACLKTAMPHVMAAQRFHTTTGIVLKSPSWIKPDEFIMTTGNPYHPEAVISLPYVHNISYFDGTEAEQIEEPKDEDGSWVVYSSTKGSKKSYVVTKRAAIWTCTCPGFAYRKHCKHISEQQRIKGDA